METFWIVFTGAYSAIFTWQITLFFRHSAESKLRAEHYKEREEERKARQGERDRAQASRYNPLSTDLISDSSPKIKLLLSTVDFKGKSRVCRANWDG